MKILCLAKYGDLAASTRQRFLQYQPHLEVLGLKLEMRPLLDNFYLERMYGGERANPMRIIKGYLDRYIAMGRSADARLIWLHYEALPYLPWALEKRILASGLPVIFDIDDAIFHRYDEHRNKLVRRFLGSKIDRVMKHSRTVFAGNNYLADRALHAGTHAVQVVPTVLDTDLYCVADSPKSGRTERAIVGWIGAPSTWTEYIVPMMPMLGAVAAECGARIMAVGAGKTASGYPNLDNRPWSETTEVSLIQEMDIGIMPLTDTHWARGKCGYKLIQYMACGIPVIASPVGVNTEIVEHGVNGFLASSDREWKDALQTLLKDPDLRARMGEAGRRKVEREYSLQVWGPRVAQMLRDVANKGTST
jgi:glycosyltransferase involved in cell wall biosynthesis